MRRASSPLCGGPLFIGSPCVGPVAVLLLLVTSSYQPSPVRGEILAAAFDVRQGTRHMFPSSGPLEGGTKLRFTMDMPDGDAEYTATFAGGSPQSLVIQPDVCSMLELAATPPHHTHEAVTVEVRMNGEPLTSFTFLYYAAPEVTSVESSSGKSVSTDGSISVSMYGGERLYLVGQFFLPADEPVVRLAALDNVMSKQLVLPLSTIDVASGRLNFNMERYILPARFPFVQLPIELSMNGVDFFQLPFSVNVSSTLAPLKVCMMFNMRADGTPGWTYATNVAKLQLEETQGAVVQVEVAEMVNGANVNETTLRFAEDGCKIIIGIHITHRRAYRALVGTRFENATYPKFVLGGEFPLSPVEDGVSTDNVGVCFPKLYDSRYLSGMLAGYMTETDVIAYIISIPIPQTLRQANAFAMGVRRANPNATVLMYGTGTWAPNGRYSNATTSWESDLLVGKLLLRQRADVFAQHTNGLGLSSLVHGQDKYTVGVWSNMGATLGDRVLVSALNVWAPCFLHYTRQVMYNEWKGQQGLFEGLIGGFSDISSISPRVPLETQAKVLAAREELLVPGTELFCGGEDGIPCHGRGCGDGDYLVYPRECLSNRDIEDSTRMNVTKLYPSLVWKGMFTAPNCPQGSFANYSQPDFETHQCDLCPPGTAAPNPYEDACTACPVGTFSEGGNCEPCRPGTYSNTTQTSQCMLCPLGQQQPDEGKSSCEPCRPGFYRGEGDTTCQPCGEDEYNPYSGQAACLKCPPNTVSKFRSAVELSQCGCMDGFFEPDGVDSSALPACEACPEVRLVARTEAGGMSSVCARMEPCMSLEQGENLTFSVFLEVISQGRHDPAILNKCNIQTNLPGVMGQFTLETAGGYTLQDVPFRELVLPEHYDHEDSQTHVDSEYVLIHRVTYTGWFLLQVTVDGIPAPFSPLVYNVKPRSNCHAYSRPNEVGECIDIPGGGGHITILINVSIALGAMLVFAAVLGLLYWRSRTSIQTYIKMTALLRQPPKKGQQVTLVITDIEGSTSLWDTMPRQMNEALATHDALLRSLMRTHHGYELLTQGDSFHVAFHRPEHAVRWCMAVQLALYQTTWSEGITKATAHAKCDKFNGLRVRMGMHSGVVDQVAVHHNTKRVQYTGELLAIAKAVQGAAAGGQVLMSGDTMAQMSTGEKAEADGMQLSGAAELVHMVHLGRHQLAVLQAHPALGPEEVAVDVDTEHQKQHRSSTMQTSTGDQSAMELNNSHEMVMMIPGPLLERELHFPTIKTDMQVTPSFYEAPHFSNVTIVFTYIERLDEIMASDPEVGRAAVRTHNLKMRTLLNKYNGYECREQDGQFLLAFHSATDALQWALDIQETLLLARWSNALLDMPAACRMMVSNCMIFRGLRVQVGICSGAVLEMKPCKRTGRAEYFGPQLNKAARVANAAHGGQILMARCAYESMDPRVLEQLGIVSSNIGKYTLKGVAEPELIYQMATGRMLLRPFTSIKAKKKQWYNSARPPRSSTSSAMTQDDGDIRFDSNWDGQGSERTKAESSLPTNFTSSARKMEMKRRASVEGKVEGGGRVCIYVHDVTLETSLKRAFTDAGCRVTTLRYIANGAADSDHANEVLDAAAHGQVFVTAGMTPGKAGRQEPFSWFALLRAELNTRCPTLIFVGEDPDDCDAAEQVGVVPLLYPFTVEDVLAALQLHPQQAGPNGATDVQQLLSHAAEYREASSQRDSSQKGSDPSIPEPSRQTPSTMLTHSTLRSFNTLNSSNSSALTSISVLVLTNVELSDTDELMDPLLCQFKKRVERRAHSLELVFSLEDAKRIFNIFADHTISHTAPKPILVLVDEPDDLKRKEMLITLREYDPNRQELLLVVAQRDALPEDQAFSQAEKKLHEQGADLLFLLGRSNDSIDLLLRTAETMQRCTAYAIQTHVLTHALLQVGVSVDVVNSQGTMLWVTPAFEELTGYRFDEVINCPVTFMEDPNGESKMGPAVNEVASLGTPWSGVMTLVTKTGKKVPHTCSITMVMTEESNPTPHLVCVRRPLAGTRPSQVVTGAMLAERDVNSNGSANETSATNPTLTSGGGSVDMNLSD